MSRRIYGVCRLTGVEGPLVDCHILPRALTKPEVAGEPFIQGPHERGPRRRWSSWYDKRLVTKEGEALLARIDDAAIKVLRRHQLVWSSWGVEPPQFEGMLVSPDHIVRELHLGDDAVALHRFAVSVVWRASASSMSEMQYVELPADLEERLRAVVVSQKAPDPGVLPTSLVQITTVGDRHNHTPMDGLKKQAAVLNVPEQSYRLTRFYLDGLIFHCHWDPDSFQQIVGNKIVLSAADTLVLVGITYEASAQKDALLHLKHQTLGPTKYPKL